MDTRERQDGPGSFLTIVEDSMLQDTRLSVDARFLYCIIKTCKVHQYPNLSTLHSLTGFEVSRILDALAQLSEAELITRDTSVNLYDQWDAKIRPFILYGHVAYTPPNGTEIKEGAAHVE